jgi:hypothetical protein
MTTKASISAALNPNAMTNDELRALVAGLSIAQAKTEALIAQTEAQLNKTMKTVESVGKQLGSIGRNQGHVAEEFFYNSLRSKPVLGDVTFDTVLANVEAGTKKHQAEFDVLMSNGNSAAVLEIKYIVHQTDLDHVEKNLKRYRDVFPQHKKYKLYGGVAGFSISQDVTKEAKRRGLFVLKRKGEIITSDVKEMKSF